MKTLILAGLKLGFEKEDLEDMTAEQLIEWLVTYQEIIKTGAGDPAPGKSYKVKRRSR